MRARNTSSVPPHLHDLLLVLARCVDRLDQRRPDHAQHLTAQGTTSLTSRVGQNNIYTVYIRYFWQGNHRIYGHIRCIYTVLANPTYER